MSLANRVETFFSSQKYLALVRLCLFLFLCLVCWGSIRQALHLSELSLNLHLTEARIKTGVIIAMLYAQKLLFIYLF